MATRATVKNSKRLSWLLRHGAIESGLAMDAAGWADVEDVLVSLQMSARDLEDAVANNDKGRIERDADRLRACQGHSLAGTPVTREALEDSWVEVAQGDTLFHGTRVDALPSIGAGGLLPGARSHVHLAAARDSKVGKRSGVSVLIRISGARLRDCGRRVFKSPNGVLLVRDVPPEAFVDVELLGRAAGRGGLDAARRQLGVSDPDGARTGNR